MGIIQDKRETEVIKHYVESICELEGQVNLLNAAFDKFISDTTGTNDPEKIQKFKEDLINADYCNECGKRLPKEEHGDILYKYRLSITLHNPEKGFKQESQHFICLECNKINQVKEGKG
jgi:hypothetical protein